MEVLQTGLGTKLEPAGRAQDGLISPWGPGGPEGSPMCAPQVSDPEGISAARLERSAVSQGPSGPREPCLS